MAELELRTKINFSYGEPRELAPGVLRIVANNPGPFTFKGTNSYIVGRRALAIIDPGPKSEDHCAAIVRAVAGRPVSHIVLTHTHHDHYDGLARLAAAYPQAQTCGYGWTGGEAGARKTAIDGSETSDETFEPDVVLRDGDKVEGDGWRLSAVYTPGHAPDHHCLGLDGTGILFSGDHVMAWNTSVVAPPEGRMADYLASLERLKGRGETLYLPGHGGKLLEPERMVKAYLLHRRWREDAILEAIKGGHGSIEEIVSLVYRGIDPRLVRAASLSVQAHVVHLLERRLVTCDGPLTFVSRLSCP